MRAPEPAISLTDKYLLESGRIFLTGVQALFRALLDQRRADRRAGLRTAALVSGYQGSPLAALDQELARNHELTSAEDIFHVPGLNEELAATAVWGSQLAGTLPDPRYDGVLGVWYGKAPGLDRAGDAIRHGNWVGTGPTGGMLALVGDDPSSKSSTIPSASEAALADFAMPVLFPGSVQDVLDYGRHGFELSRASGLWAGIKMVTNVADAVGTAEVDPQRIVPRDALNGAQPGEPHRPHGNLLAPYTLELERSLFEVRIPHAIAYARANGLNPVTVESPSAWLGIAASGKSYFDLLQAFEDLGLGDDELRRLGVRVLKVGMPYPLDPAAAREFASGLDELMVVEEKRAFLETQLKEALYGAAGAPRIVGKRDQQERPLLPATGELDSVMIAEALVSRLAERESDLAPLQERVAHLRRLRDREHPAPALARTPFFCSGCPHNRSTVAPDDSAVGIGIGCHTMVLLNPEGKGHLAGVTQMGGEGAQWVGMEPFTGMAHFVQNLGDGTFAHSGSLGIRFAVAAGANITFKLLYNRAVAMTGGQEVEGALEVPELTRMLEAEGVKRIIVTSDEQPAYRRRMAGIAEYRDRSGLLEAQRELAATPGVTVLIHDQECAAELRRLRKRGKAPDPDLRVLINERVCEGCGDCGEKSGCLSVQPVETEFGRKTQIHQPSCNKDYSCLDGDCPSFVTVVGAQAAGKRAVEHPDIELPEPQLRVPADDFRVRFPGIGGTGVVTINQLLGMAALLEGRHAAGLDQTGLAQKGGPVISDLRIGRRALRGASKAPTGGAHLYLVFDLLTATTAANLAVTDPERTVAVVSTGAVPTGKMVTDTGLSFPDRDELIDRIEAATRAGENFYLDAEALAMQLFDDHMPANVLALGAAYQWGAIPLAAESIEAAIRLNGAAVEKNLAAFAWGRACVVSPDLIEQATKRPQAEEETRPPTEAEAELIARFGDDEELTQLVGIRVRELGDYQGLGYARDYADFVARVREAERAAAPGRTALSEAVARNLHKLMAYKDEYEVARLHLLAGEHARQHEQFGDRARFYWMLHPPLLRALGLRRKLRLGRWFAPFLRLLRSLRWLRGRAIDPFGHTRVRRVERALPGEYRDAVSASLASLDGAGYERAIAIAELPDLVRGYEQIKLRNVERYRAELRRLTEAA
ncbi:MAG: indolepyruvate ferredoxin oxidoreductase family protein [Solirubrobacterales bacterium]